MRISDWSSDVCSSDLCAGAGNWGRSGEVLASLDTAGRYLPVGCDCYPYSASSSTLDLQQVTDEFDIDITWSDPHPEMAGRKLAAVAAQWQVPLREAADRKSTRLNSSH